MRRNKSEMSKKWGSTTLVCSQHHIRALRPERKWGCVLLRRTANQCAPSQHHTAVPCDLNEAGHVICARAVLHYCAFNTAAMHRGLSE